MEGKLSKQKRVMLQFDEDEPFHIDNIFEGGEFSIVLKEGSIQFTKNGKAFKIYMEEEN